MTTANVREPERLAVRKLLEANRRPDDRLALGLFCIDLLMFVGLCLAAVLGSPAPLQLAAGVLAGAVGLRLSCLAHDAAHQSYTSKRKWNKLIARIGFLPLLQPVGTWEVAHNVIHHSWTSIRNKDYVWIPFSKQDYDALSDWRRFLERVYRSPFGQGVYYVIELWWRLVVIPSTRWSEIIRKSHRFDIVLVVTAALAWGAGIAALSIHLGRSPVWGVFCGEVTPFLGVCQFLGWALYVQHTHPRTAFYDDRAGWEFFRAQSTNSTHVEFPGVLDKFAHGLFDHTAHHLDVKIPFYRLPEVEAELDRMLKGGNVVVRWSWKEFLRTTRMCKLYDYDRHCWMDFEGRPTAYVDRGHPL